MVTRHAGEELWEAVPRPLQAMPDKQDAIMSRIKIRRAEPADIEQILGLVRDVVRERYGHLFPGEPPVPTDPDPWSGSWVADADGSIVGVGLAEGDYIDDLWLRPWYRRQNIGSALLSALESQIAKEGYARARLRLVAENEEARRFYTRRGWQETDFHPHEKWGFLMVEMHKDFST